MSNDTECRWQIMGIAWPTFAVVAMLILGACYAGVLPGGMVGAIPLMMVLGAIFNEIGNRTPVVKDYFGGGPIVIIFASAALATSFSWPDGASKPSLLPTASVEIVRSFMTREGFLDFYIAALITGSLLGMNRSLLIRAAVRYLPAVVGGLFAALGLCALVGLLIGHEPKDAVLGVAMPIMGGGMGAGAVPMSKIYSEIFRLDQTAVLSKMIPAVALGNAIAIVAAGMLNQLGKAIPSWTGNGVLLRGASSSDAFEQNSAAPDLEGLGIGLLLSCSFFVWGGIVAKLFDELGWAQRVSLHPYAIMILTVALVKVLGIMPRRYEQAAAQWFRFVMVSLTPALLVGIGIAYTDLNEVAAAFSPQYLILVVAAVVGAIVGSGAVGYMCGLYPIESAVTAGLCMANMGGTGDVAVLSACDRIVLMPFAQISSRIGGAFVLILASVLLRWLG